MVYELFQQDPFAFILVFLLSVAITALAYGAFPFIFSKIRKAPITKKKYKHLCFCVNLIVMIAFMIIKGGIFNGFPYFLWTSLFVSWGNQILGTRGIMTDSEYLKEDPNRLTGCKNCGYQTPDFFDACPECGHHAKQYVYLQKNISRDSDQSRVCYKCGNHENNCDYCSKCGCKITNDIMDDSRSNESYSISRSDEEYIPTPGYHFYGNDLMLQQSDDIASVAETVAAPVESGSCESIRPKSEKQSRMVRATPEEQAEIEQTRSEQTTATVQISVDEESALPINKKLVTEAVSSTVEPQLEQNEFFVETINGGQSNDVEVNQVDQKAKARKAKYCSKCGALIDNETKVCTGCGKRYSLGIKLFSKHLKVAIGVILVTVIITLCITQCTTIQAFKKQINDMEQQIQSGQSKINSLQNQLNFRKSEISQLEDEISELESSLQNNEELAQFIDWYVVFIEDDDTDLYHKFNCQKFTGEVFWVLNLKAAEVQGYSPCPLCY